MNIGILTSGGDAPGMNAFISNFTKLCVSEKFSVFAFKCGFQGLIDNDIVRLAKKDVENISHLGGSYIKSFRSSEFTTKQGYNEALKNIAKNNIDYLVIIGGDGTQKGSAKLAKDGVKVIFVPATIDNDLMYTDKTLGFDSAVNCAVEIIDKIKQTMLSLNRIFICEVMGRHCPDIAKYCAVATNATYLIAEKEDLNLEKIFSKISSALKNGEDAPHIIVRENTVNINDLAKKIQNQFDIETRANSIGYVQRGTTPSVYDRILAKQFSTFVLSLIKKNVSNIAIATIDNKMSSEDISTSLVSNVRSLDDLTTYI